MMLKVKIPKKLRIPMRGYEKGKSVVVTLKDLVTNPHEGL